MTNSRLTDPEILETRLPVRLDQFAIRRGSGGAGRTRAATASYGASRSSSRCAPTSSPIAAACRRAGFPGGATRARRNWVERAEARSRCCPRRLRPKCAGRSFVIETRAAAGSERRMIDYWPLIGIALVVVGFALRLNPLLVVTAAAIVTGLLGGMDLEVCRPSARRSTRTARRDRLDRPAGHGPARALRPAAARAALIRGCRGDDRAAADPLSALPPDHRRDRPDFDRRPPADRAAAGRADGAGRGREAARRTRRRHGRAGQGMAAATDNVGLFFGEDIFFAIGSIVLIQGSLATYGTSWRRSSWRSGRSPARSAPS